MYSCIKFHCPQDKFFFFDEQDNIIYSTIVNTLCVEIKSGKLCYNILEIISILCHSYYGK